MIRDRNLYRMLVNIFGEIRKAIMSHWQIFVSRPIWMSSIAMNLRTTTFCHFVLDGILCRRGTYHITSHHIISYRRPLDLKRQIRLKVGTQSTHTHAESGRGREERERGKKSTSVCDLATLADVCQSAKKSQITVTLSASTHCAITLH